MFECCFLISKYHENYNVMSVSSFTVLTSCTLEYFYLQCSSMFSLVCYGFYLLFTIFFSDAADNKQLACWKSSRRFSFPMQYSKKCSKIITIKKILCYFEEQKCIVEIWNFKNRNSKRLATDDWQATRV